jgi:hypothetical protein
MVFRLLFYRLCFSSLKSLSLTAIIMLCYTIWLIQTIFGCLEYLSILCLSKIQSFDHTVIEKVLRNGRNKEAHSKYKHFEQATKLTQHVKEIVNCPLILDSFFLPENPSLEESFFHFCFVLIVVNRHKLLLNVTKVPEGKFL